MTRIEAARLQLLDVVHELDGIKFRLLGVQASLPPTDVETDPLLESDATDPATGIRTVIACVLNDHLGPAIHDLEGTGIGAFRGLPARLREL